MSGFIAVHVGAGYHAESKRIDYQTVCKKSCKVAINLMKQNASAVDAITEAMCVLENDPLTNAGIGSNLTLDGLVECDAGIMDGKSLNFGSVTSIYGIKNPIQVAACILKEQNDGLLSCGRVPPVMVSGKGAVQWARERGFSIVDSKVLVTKSAYGAYAKNVNILKSVAETKKTDIGNAQGILLDTVGAICVDKFGTAASAVSSGGLMLKHSGRVGQASVYGAGCWAENNQNGDIPNIAVSVSGVGEYIIKTCFARECFHSLCQSDDSLGALVNAFNTKFLDSPYLRNVDLKLAGTIALKYFFGDTNIELSWAHTTKTMIIGYMSLASKKPRAFVSLQPDDLLCGKSVVACGKKI